jgi:putative FmdB family regulatory protein
MIYEYRCQVCQKEFEIECSMSEHKSTVNCDYCYTQDGAKQLFRPETMPSVKIWQNSIIKNITFDYE